MNLRKAKTNTYTTEKKLGSLISSENISNFLLTLLVGIAGFIGVQCWNAAVAIGKIETKIEYAEKRFDRIDGHLGKLEESQKEIISLIKSKK